MLQAQQAYAAAAPVRTPRQAEHQVVAQVTARLAAALAADDCARLAAAVHDNSRLWSALAADLASPGNALPAELRARLLGLAGFALRQGHRVLRGEGGGEALVDLNTAVLRGLAGQSLAGAETGAETGAAA
jgi:flagellar protein FlaF